MTVATYHPMIKQGASWNATGSVLELGATTSGFKGLGDYCVNGDVVPYWFTNATGEWEYGRGTYATGSPATLTRTNTLNSSASGGGSLSLTSGQAVTLTLAQQPYATPTLIYAGTATGYSCTGSNTKIDWNNATTEYDQWGSLTSGGTINIDTDRYKFARASVTTTWPESSATGTTYRRTSVRFRQRSVVDTIYAGTDTTTGAETTSVTVVTQAAEWDPLTVRCEHDSGVEQVVRVDVLVEAWR